VRSWRAAADDGRRSIEHFSRLLWPYPWPQMTLVEGIVEGGMEYPMLSAVSVGPDARDLRATIAHEIGHMWFPMQVGTNERRFAWVDEGFASWLERSLLRVTNGPDDETDGLPSLYRIMGSRNAPSMMVHSDHYASGMAYTMASYEKPVVVLRAFAAEFGDSALVAGIRALGARWSGRHPYPADVTRLLFAAAGREREAFVRDWVVGTGTFDAAIVSVTRAHETLDVQVRVSGGARLSVPVVITRDDGRTETITLAASAFRTAPVQTIRVGSARRVRRIELDPTRTRPDFDTGNQQWTP
jgi:aminopeptidase N